MNWTRVKTLFEKYILPISTRIEKMHARLIVLA
jgi:hypothetical protein